MDFINKIISDPTQLTIVVGIALALFGKKLYPILDPILAMIGYTRNIPTPAPGPVPTPVPTPVIPGLDIWSILQLLINRSDSKGTAAASTIMETVGIESEAVRARSK